MSTHNDTYNMESIKNIQNSIKINQLIQFLIGF